MDTLEEEIRSLHDILNNNGTKKVISMKNINEIQFRKNVITMKKGDLLKEAETTSIAHCVGADLMLSDGLAKHIKGKFKSFRDSKPPANIGDIIVQDNGMNFILHMVTKMKSFEKPK